MNHLSPRSPSRRRIPAAMTAAAVLVAFALPALAHNERGESKADFGGKSVSVEYGRPMLQGRDMLAQAMPGMVWRLGSDTATSIMSDGELMFGSTAVPAGSYSLFARRTEGGWELIVNGQTGQWGTDHDPAQDVATVPLQMEETEEHAEMFTISVMAEDDMHGALKLHWGNTALVTPLMVH